MSTIDGEKRRGNHLNIFADKELELREALSTSVVQSDVDCQESVDSPVIRIHLIRVILLVSAIACDFIVPLFFVPAHCRQQCRSYSPCQERKAQQL